MNGTLHALLEDEKRTEDASRSVMMNSFNMTGTVEAMLCTHCPAVHLMTMLRGNHKVLAVWAAASSP